MSAAMGVVAVLVLLAWCVAAIFYWFGWDNRGDVEETRRWEEEDRRRGEMP